MEEQDDRPAVHARLLWGDPAALKASLREEDERAHLARPIAERLIAAFSLVARAEHRGADR